MQQPVLGTAQLSPAPRPAHNITHVPQHVAAVAAVVTSSGDTVARVGVATRGARTRATCGDLRAGAGAAVVASPAFSSSVPLVEIRLLPSTRSSVSLFCLRSYLHTSSFDLPL